MSSAPSPEEASRPLSPSGLLPPAGLVVVWLLFFGRVTPGLLLTGVVIAVVLVPPWRTHELGWTVRPLQFVRSLGGVAWALVMANIEVARETIRPTEGVPPGIIDVRMRRLAPGLDRLVAVLVTMTPGTVVLSLRRDDDGTVLRVHALLADSVERVRADVLHLEDLVADALAPSPRAGHDTSSTEETA